MRIVLSKNKINQNALPKVDLRHFDDIMSIATAYFLAQLTQKEWQQQIFQIIWVDFVVRFIGTEQITNTDQTCGVLKQMYTFLNLTLQLKKKSFIRLCRCFIISIDASNTLRIFT